MLAAVAQRERNLLVERTQTGLARAKTKGRTLGRPGKKNQEQCAAMTCGKQSSSGACARKGCFDGRQLDQDARRAGRRPGRDRNCRHAQRGRVRDYDCKVKNSVCISEVFPVEVFRVEGFLPTRKTE